MTPAQSIGNTIQALQAESIGFDMKEWLTTGPCGSRGCLAGHIVLYNAPAETRGKILRDMQHGPTPAEQEKRLSRQFQGTRLGYLTEEEEQDFPGGYVPYRGQFSMCYAAAEIIGITPQAGRSLFLTWNSRIQDRKEAIEVLEILQELHLQALRPVRLSQKQVKDAIAKVMGR